MLTISVQVTYDHIYFVVFAIINVNIECKATKIELKAFLSGKLIICDGPFQLRCVFDASNRRHCTSDQINQIIYICFMNCVVNSYIYCNKNQNMCSWSI